MSLNTGGHHSGMDKQGATKYADTIDALPPGIWTVQDIPRPVGDRIDKLRNLGVVAVTGTTLTENDKLINKYHVPDHIETQADDVIAQREPICPCGHKGLRNQGEHYTCAFELCPNTYSREDLEADQ